MLACSNSLTRNCFTSSIRGLLVFFVYTDCWSAWPEQKFFYLHMFSHLKCFTLNGGFKHLPSPPLDVVLKKQSYLKVEHKVADQIGLENHGSTPSLMSINKKKVFFCSCRTEEEVQAEFEKCGKLFLFGKRLYFAFNLMDVGKKYWFKND